MISPLWSAARSQVEHIYSSSSLSFLAQVFSVTKPQKSAYLGYGGCEIFPKQEELLVERGDIGNFINLPYFDAEQTMRYASKKMEMRRTLPSSWI